MELLNKHRPDTLDCIKNNYSQVLKIKKILNDKNTGFHIIVGTVSTGKTTIIDIINSNKQYDVLRIDSNTNFQNTSIQNIITNFILNNSITSFFMKPKKKIICIDDINIISHLEKHLYSVINTAKLRCLIVSTVQIKEYSKLNELKKCIEDVQTNVIYLNKISVQECMVLIMNIVDKENLLNVDEDNIMKLIKRYSCDIRKIFNDYHYFFNEQIIESIDKEKTNELYDKTLYDLTNKVFTSKLDISDNSFFSNDIQMVSYILHENLPNKVFKNSVSKSVIENYIKIMNHLVTNEMIDNYCYANSQWNLLYYKNIYVYINISRMLSGMSIQNNDSLTFTQILSNMSSKTILQKKINTVNKYMLTNELLLLNMKESCKEFKHIKHLQTLCTKLENDF